MSASFLAAWWGAIVATFTFARVLYTWRKSADLETTKPKGAAEQVTLDEIAAALRADRVTTDEVVAMVNGINAGASRSAVRRYAKDARRRMEAHRRAREAQEAVAAWVRRVQESGGDVSPYDLQLITWAAALMVLDKR